MTGLLAGHREPLAVGAVLLHAYAAPSAEGLLQDIAHIAAQAPFRRMITRGGHAMSVAMTNCGALGWVSDRSGYRYSPADPDTGRNWPPMPPSFAALARAAAAEAGFPAFAPDACLVNRYQPGAKMGLHQDRDEAALDAPIVSVSLGLPATFLFGGLTRTAKVTRHPLDHGDVVVWGGPVRLAYHGIAPLAPGDHPATGACRLNLTFRRAAP